MFSGRKDFQLGKQPQVIEGTETMIFVMPSSSARCSHLPRASDKLPFYVALKKLRDHLRNASGRDVPSELDETQLIFPPLKSPVKKSAREAQQSRVAPEDGDPDGNYFGYRFAAAVAQPQLIGHVKKEVVAKVDISSSSFQPSSSSPSSSTSSTSCAQSTTSGRNTRRRRRSRGTKRNNNKKKMMKKELSGDNNDDDTVYGSSSSLPVSAGAPETRFKLRSQLETTTKTLTSPYFT